MYLDTRAFRAIVKFSGEIGVHFFHRPTYLPYLFPPIFVLRFVTWPRSRFNLERCMETTNSFDSPRRSSIPYQSHLETRRGSKASWPDYLQKDICAFSDDRWPIIVKRCCYLPRKLSSTWYRRTRDVTEAANYRCSTDSTNIHKSWTLTSARAASTA